MITVTLAEPALDRADQGQELVEALLAAGRLPVLEPATQKEQAAAKGDQDLECVRR